MDSLLCVIRWFWSVLRVTAFLCATGRLLMLDSFQGLIDEVMIWKGTFTAEEIQEIMLAPGIEFLDVEPRGKLATTWATLKQSL